MSGPLESRGTFDPSPDEQGTPPPGNVALLEAQEMTGTARDALVAARRLKTYVDSDDDAVSRTAASMLSALIADVGFAATHSAVGGPIDNRLLRAGLRVEEHLAGPRPTDQPSRGYRWVMRQWTLLGALLSLGGAALLVSGLYAAAAICLLLRVTVSAAVDLPPRGASGQRQHAIAYWSVARCLSGHACDATLLLAVGYSFAANERPLWAWGSAAVAVLMLFATVTRLSALQFGLPLRRLALERVARNGLMLGGLCAAAIADLADNDPVRGTVPVLALTLVGSGVYAVVEMLRVRWRVQLLFQARREAKTAATATAQQVLMLDVTGSVRTPQSVV